MSGMKRRNTEWDISVSIVTTLQKEKQRNHSSIFEEDKKFLIVCKTSRAALEPTHSGIWWAQEALPGGKEVDTYG